MRAFIVAGILSLVFPISVHGGEVEAIQHEISDGLGEIEFPENSILRQLPFYKIKSFKGPWKNGKADGYGVLNFNSPFHYSGGEELSQFKIPVQEVSFEGEFKEGKPIDGVIKWEKRWPSKEMQIIGIPDREDEMPNQVVVSIEGYEVAAATKLANAVLIRAAQYSRIGSMPSRVYFGRLDPNKRPIGSWVDLPWFFEHPNGEVVAGYKNHLEITDVQGGQHSCAMNEDLPPPNVEMSGYFNFGDFDAGLMVRMHDKRYMQKGVCDVVTPEGWRFRYELDVMASPTTKFLECWTPSGKSAVVQSDGYCHEKKKKKHDFFTNLAKEAQRFLDRRVVGNINKVFGTVERVMCRATGTEPGTNCHVNMSVGATLEWEPDTNQLDNYAKEEAAKKVLAETSDRAKKLREKYVNAPEIAGMAEANAICMSVCQTAAGRSYSSALLTELESVAPKYTIDSLGEVRTQMIIGRETAQALQGGLTFLKIVVAAGVPTSVFYKYVHSVKTQSEIVDALEAVKRWGKNANTTAKNKQYVEALTRLEKLQFAQMKGVAVESASLLEAGMLASFKGYKPKTHSMKIFAIIATVAKTAKEAKEWQEKFAHVKSDKEFYDGLIKEIVSPLGIDWPLKK